jgi:phosphoribosylformylglycinamidine synthase PurS subunit
MITIMIHILPKKDILDPQGKTVLRALNNLGFHEVEEVRMGKLIKLNVNSNNETESLEACKRMCDELLINPLIETYTMEVVHA